MPLSFPYIAYGEEPALLFGLTFSQLLTKVVAVLSGLRTVHPDWQLLFGRVISQQKMCWFQSVQKSFSKIQGSQERYICNSCEQPQ